MFFRRQTANSAGVQSPQGMTLVNMPTEQASHPGPLEVPEARLQAPGPVLTERTQGGYQAQKSLVTSRLMFRLTVTMATN